MNRHQRDLMLHLADLLRELADKQDRGVACPAFNMATWMKTKAGTPLKVTNVHTPVQMPVDTDSKELCGTACCALGLAATDETFKREGLCLVVPKQGRHDVAFVSYQTAEGYDAAMQLFGISYANAIYLFSPDSYSTAPDARTVANRLENAAALLTQ